MLPEIGQIALIIALMLALTQATLPLIGAARGIPQLIALARPSAQAQFIFVAGGFCFFALFFIKKFIFFVVFTPQFIPPAPPSNSLYANLGCPQASPHSLA